MNDKEEVRNLFSLTGEAKGWNERYNRVETLFDHIIQHRRDYALDYCLRNSDASAKVADIGCGAGALMESLRDEGYKPVGLDYSGDMLSFARKRCLTRGQGQKLVQGDSEALPFNDEEFDMVISLGMISYIRRDMKAVSEIRRVLKPNGMAVLSVRNSLRPVFFDPARLFQALPSKFFKYLGPGSAKKGEVRGEADDGFIAGRYYNPFRLKRQLEEAGFLIKGMKGIGYGPFKFFGRELFSQATSIKINLFLNRLFNGTKTASIFEWFTDVSIFILVKK